MANPNSIRTVDTDRLAREIGNIYEAVVITSKRARQIAAQEKGELDVKLSYFEDLSLDVTADEIRTNEDQLRISLEYERRPKASLRALEEMEKHQVYHRNPTSDEEGDA